MREGDRERETSIGCLPPTHAPTRAGDPGCNRGSHPQSVSPQAGALTTGRPARAVLLPLQMPRATACLLFFPQKCLEHLLGAGPCSGPGEHACLPGGGSLVGLGQSDPAGGGRASPGSPRALNLVTPLTPLCPQAPSPASSQSPPSCCCQCHQVGGDPSPRTFPVTLISRPLRAVPGAEVNFTPGFLPRWRFLGDFCACRSPGPTSAALPPSVTCRLG